MKFSSLAALQIVKMATYSATRWKFDKVMTFLFQWLCDWGLFDNSSQPINVHTLYSKNYAHRVCIWLFWFGYVGISQFYPYPSGLLLWPDSIWRCLTSIAIPKVSNKGKMVIFIMGISLLVRQHLFIKLAPVTQHIILALWSVKQPWRTWKNKSHQSSEQWWCSHNKTKHNEPLCIIHGIYSIQRTFIVKHILFVNTNLSMIFLSINIAPEHMFKFPHTINRIAILSHL